MTDRFKVKMKIKKSNNIKNAMMLFCMRRMTKNAYVPETKATNKISGETILFIALPPIINGKNGPPNAGARAASCACASYKTVPMFEPTSICARTYPILYPIII
jgi:hypothetical protein